MRKDEDAEAVTVTAGDGDSVEVNHREFQIISNPYSTHSNNNQHQFTSFLMTKNIPFPRTPQSGQPELAQRNQPLSKKVERYHQHCVLSEVQSIKDIYDVSWK
ncbi:uncharacterized protein MELLADRAFT_105141 [Melampsora larici-populina 98AG31]|uniref:Uncharacterized protein n=1 Tax=Melampsora larici-populina (strain 98AG31 / pathotype 3-4-7) TaxID=747676 RepID=F4RGR9_MELLP|nr:uncharacterized protein MELLADRAFT_105141 [Melampsora larici-populina 98AG31]EGG08343.1 hypothetical protein MELLADRAFT_105141 [Melampsora larici-populina 98AG31]